MLVFSVAVYVIAGPAHARLIREDGPVETLTAISVGRMAVSGCSLSDAAEAIAVGIPGST
jgi:hypothetical protein